MQFHCIWMAKDDYIVRVKRYWHYQLSMRHVLEDPKLDGLSHYPIKCMHDQYEQQYIALSQATPMPYGGLARHLASP
jgi:hypothetical protein